MEQRIINLLKSLKNLHEILEKNFNDLYLSGLKLGILYGLVNSQGFGGSNSNFHPVLSLLGMPTYKLAKFCDKLLKPTTTNKYKNIHSH